MNLLPPGIVYFGAPTMERRLSIRLTEAIRSCGPITPESVRTLLKGVEEWTISAQEYLDTLTPEDGSGLFEPYADTIITLFWGTDLHSDTGFEN